ncbi:NADPH-dependent FMN reductase [Aliihoeflea sp. PC F10.4]
MSKPKIAIVIGSVRPNRFAGHPAEWIKELGDARSDLDFEIVDLKDYPLPFFDEEVSPAWGPSKSEVAQRWQAKLDEFDGFVFTAAEYNHAPTGVLKNAFDYAVKEWANKPAAFVGYGGVGGARAVEHLRLISVEAGMAPIKTAVHIQWPVMVEVNGGKKLVDIDFLQDGAKAMLDQLSWWTHALKIARDKDEAQAKAA